MIYTLYKTTNLKNKKFYIGVHTTEDEFFGTDKWKDPYVGSGNAIWNALKKYGRDSFKVEILEYFPDEKSAYDAEAKLVTEKWLTENTKKVYNINVGGSSPPTQSKTKWINNGVINKRAANVAPIEGWFVGRLFQFSDEELNRRREKLRKSNLINNPMKNPNNVIKNVKSNLGKTPWNKGLTKGEK